MTIRKAKPRDAQALLALIDALANFEKLRKPSTAARKRLIRDAFGKNRRFDTFLAFVGDKAVGYAIFFETYSSFLALPTLYLEDLFVLPVHRRQKIGLRLFLRCVQEAAKRKCGRMEWMVLDWNSNALHFYKKVGARQLKEWLLFRLEEKQLSSFRASVARNHKG